MTLTNIRGWARSAAVDYFYVGRGNTKLKAFHVKSCSRLSSGLFRCHVTWRKKPYAFAGTVTMGNVNAKTGHFEFGFALIRRNMTNGTRKRIHVAY